MSLASSDQGWTAERRETAEKILEFFARQQLKLGDSFDAAVNRELINDAIVDSLGIVELVAYVENEFGISFAAEHLAPETLQSVASIVDVVSQLKVAKKAA